MTVWNKSGTVAVTNGSATVQGTGTGLYGKAAPGYAFVGPDARVYEVVSVNLAEQITLASPYLGATASGAAYAVFPTLGLAAQLVAAVQALITAQQAIEASQVVAANGDRQFYSAEGGLIAMLTNSGLFGVGTANPLEAMHLRAQAPAVMLEETDAPSNEKRWRLRPIDGDLRLEGVNDGYSASSPAMVFRRVDALHQTKAIEFYTQNIMRAILDENGFLGVGTTAPLRPLHVFQSSASSTRLRIENGEGWADLLADAGQFRVTTNVSGQAADTRFLTFDGVNGNLGINMAGLDRLHVHEGTSNACVFRMSNTEGAVQIRQDGGDNLYIRPLTGGVDRYRLYSYGRLDVEGDASNNNHKLGVFCENLSFSNNMARIVADRPGGSGFDFLSCFSNDAVSADRDFFIRGDGAAFSDVDFNSGGADYAEFFEWADGNAQGEDRRGVSVVLEGALIRPALAGEDPFGVISASPSVVGDSDIDRWKDKYLRDEFGSTLYEDYQVVAWEGLRPVQDPETGVFGGAFVLHQYAADALPEGVTPPEDATWTTQQRRVLNPLWRSDEAYIPRSERAEWDCVGMMGKLRLRKGQPVGARWLKMRDVSVEVEEWLVR